MIGWIDAVLKNEARKNAGDPGLVLARRLSNAEYNYTIRDLTGVDIRPTREFPVDPANPAGFDNSGESLAMSPALLNKYLQAAREVANHLVLKPNGLAFAPHLMLVETDRDKYCVSQIVNFYQRQATDYSRLFSDRLALQTPRGSRQTESDAGRLRCREQGQPQVSRHGLAHAGRDQRRRGAYCETPGDVAGTTRAEGQPTGNLRETAATGCATLWCNFGRKLEPRFPGLTVKGMRATSQPFLMWKNRQYATHRRDYDRDALQVEGQAQNVQIDSAPKSKSAAENDVADEEAAERR